MWGGWVLDPHRWGGLGSTQGRPAATCRLHAMTGSSSDHDRAAILRRRAALVASALAGLGCPAAAQAQEIWLDGQSAGRVVPDEGEDAPCPAPPTADDLARARVERAQAAGAASRKDFRQAAELAKKAFYSSRTDEDAVLTMDLFARAALPEAAAKVGLVHLRCGGSVDAVRAKMVEIEAGAARVIINLLGPSSEGVQVSLNGVDMWPSRLARGVLVAPGSASFTIRGADGTTTSQHVTGLEKGGSVSADVIIPARAGPAPRRDFDGGPRVCLSVYVPSPPNSSVLISGGVVAPFVGVAFGPTSTALGGAGGQLSLQVRVGDWYEQSIWCGGDIYALALGGESTQIVMAGVAGDATWRYKKLYGIGVGGTLGSMTVVGGAEHPTLRDSFFFGLVAIPAVLRFDGVEIQAKTALYFAETSSRGVISYRPAIFAPFVSVAFGGGIGG